MKDIHILSGSLGSNYSVLKTVSSSFKECAESMGAKVFVHDWAVSDRKALSGFLSAASSNDIWVFAIDFLFDMNISSFNHYDRRSIIDILEIPTVCYIQDYPYSEFYWSRIAEMPRNAIACLMDEAMLDAMRLVTDQALRVAHLPAPLAMPLHFYSQPRPIEDRPIDIFVPITFPWKVESIESLLDRICSENVKAKVFGHEIYNALISSSDISPVFIFRDAVKKHFGIEPNEWHNVDKNAGKYLVYILSQVDILTRKHKRIEMAKCLMSVPDHHRICFTSNKEEAPSWAKKKNVRFLGNTDFRSTIEICKLSKVVVNCTPPYINSVHERVINATASGAVSLSDKNLGLKQKYTDGESIVFTDRISLPDIIKNLDSEHLQDIANNGRKITIDSFSMEVFSENIIKMFKNGFPQ